MEEELETTSLEFDCYLQFPYGSPLTELSDFRQSARSGNERECKQVPRVMTSSAPISIQASTFSMQIFKFQRLCYELSFLFPPRRQSTPESLLSGYGNKTNKQKSPQESSIVGVHCFFCDDGTSRKTPKFLLFSRLYGRWSSFQTCDYPELILFIFFIYCIPGSGIIWLDGVRCIGFEPSLTLCLNSGWGETNCDPSHGEDAWVICDNSTVKDISNNFCRQVNSGSCADHQVIIQNANSVRAHYIGWLLRRYENHTAKDFC